MKETRKQLNIYIDDMTFSNLRVMAHDSYKSMSAYIRWLIDEQLERDRSAAKAETARAIKIEKATMDLI